jgi:hypothetical protein
MNKFMGKSKQKRNECPLKILNSLRSPCVPRGLFLGQDLHKMCKNFKDNGSVPRAQKRIAAFQAAVPAAFSAEDWGFVFILIRCAYGAKIVHSSGKCVF